MFDLLHKATPEFIDKLIVVVLDAIKAFADNQESQSRFFTTIEKMLQEGEPHNIIQVIPPSVVNQLTNHLTENKVSRDPDRFLRADNFPEEDIPF